MDNFAHSVVSSLIFFVLIYWIWLLCDWSFYLCHCQINICHSVASCLFLLWHQESFLRSLLLLLLLRIFHVSVSWWFSLEFEWQQVSSCLQNSSQYSGHLNNAVIWTVSTHPAILKSSGHCNNHLMTVQRIPIGIIVIFMFNSLARSRCK